MEKKVSDIYFVHRINFTTELDNPDSNFWNKINSQFINKEELKDKIDKLLFTFNDTKEGQAYQKGVQDMCDKILKLLED